jgi:transposase-like protein
MANRKIGRVEFERRRRIVWRWRRSGESASKFGGRLGISQWALYAWAKLAGSGVGRQGRASGKRRSRLAATKPSAAHDFVPVQLVQDEQVGSPAARDGIVEIQFRGGEVVRVVGEVSIERVRAVLAAVRQAC